MENTTTTETQTAPAARILSTEERAEIAQTIIAQINHSDFWARARWGVKEALALGTPGSPLGSDTVGVQFNCTKRIKIIITLDLDDTYSIEIGRLVGRFDYSKKAERDGVYVDSLVKVIDAEFSKAFGRI